MTVQRLIDLLSKLPESMRQLPIKIAYEIPEYWNDGDGYYDQSDKLVIRSVLRESLRFSPYENYLCIAAGNAQYEFDDLPE